MPTTHSMNLLTIGVNIRAAILIECESYKFYLWLCRTANADERNTALLKRWRFNAPIRHKESRRPYRVVKNAPRVRPIFFLPRWIVKRLAFFQTSRWSLVKRFFYFAVIVPLRHIANLNRKGITTATTKKKSFIYKERITKLYYKVRKYIAKL